MTYKEIAVFVAEVVFEKLGIAVRAQRQLACGVVALANLPHRVHGTVGSGSCC